jgi:hypothetical protein
VAWPRLRRDGLSRSFSGHCILPLLFRNGCGTVGSQETLKTEMDENKARSILGDAIKEDNHIHCLGHYMAWYPDEDKITLDCQFTADELEALAWWMKNKRHS